MTSSLPTEMPIYVPGHRLPDKQKKLAGLLTRQLAIPTAYRALLGKGQPDPRVVQTHEPTWLGRMVGKPQPSDLVNKALNSVDAVDRSGAYGGAMDNHDSSMLLAMQLASAHPEYFRPLNIDTATADSADPADSAATLARQNGQEPPKPTHEPPQKAALDLASLQQMANQHVVQPITNAVKNFSYDKQKKLAEDEVPPAAHSPLTDEVSRTMHAAGGSAALPAIAATALGLGLLPSAAWMYGSATSPRGRVLHGAASAKNRLMTTATGAALGGLGGGILGGLLTGDAALNTSAGTAAALAGAGLGGYGGYQWGKATHPGPVELGLGDKDTEPARKAALDLSSLQQAANQHVVQPIINAVKNFSYDKHIVEPLAQRLPTVTTDNPNNAWWRMPAAVGAGGLGLGIGYGAVNSGLKALKKRDNQAQLAAAEKEYQDALEAQYRQLLHSKTSSIAQLYDLKKTGSWTVNDMLQGAGGYYGGAAALLAALFGAQGYRAGRQTGEAALTDKALQLRALSRPAPQPPLAVPVTLDEQIPSYEKKLQQESLL